MTTTLPRTVAVEGGWATIGTDHASIRRVVAEWRIALVDATYTEEALERWISKECPPFQTLVERFHLGWAPVTNSEYTAFLAEVEEHRPESIVISMPDDHPVWPVAFPAAQAYCRWLSARTGRRVRLPTEVEWEWAAGGPEHLEYPWGNRFDPARCNTAETGIGTTTPVGTYPMGTANCGAVDLAGNVEELTASRYAPYSGGKVVRDDLFNMHPNGYHVLRGGGCTLGGDAARVARRHGPVGDPRFRFQGFRISADGPLT